MLLITIHALIFIPIFPLMNLITSITAMPGSLADRDTDYRKGREIVLIGEEEKTGEFFIDRISRKSERINIG
jgi:hypothetical protein